MELQAAYPVVVVAPSHVAECRDFYVRCFGFEVIFQASWFVYLGANDGGSLGIAFMASDHPSRPPGPETFGGQGMFFTIQVADAKEAFARLQAEDAQIAYPLRDEVWGQRRFGLHDPAGTWVDVVQQIEPVPGFWDPYLE
jgi:catechol 2,3-dioxygenase-like lactoylglutathione lyase family enzyme